MYVSFSTLDKVNIAAILTSHTYSYKIGGKGNGEGEKEQTRGREGRKMKLVGEME